jgi:hypothetical protein
MKSNQPKEMTKLNNAQDAIQQAIEGGYSLFDGGPVEVSEKGTWPMVYAKNNGVDKLWPLSGVLLDPLFWIALGKARGWSEWTRMCIVHGEISPEETTFYEKCDRCSGENDTYCEPTAFQKAHKWLTTRLSNGDETKFWQSLL